MRKFMGWQFVLLLCFCFYGSLFSQDVVTIPFRSDFESGMEGWQFANDQGKNVWVRGYNASGCSGSYALYISNNDGAANNYNVNTASVSHAFFKVDIPATGASLSFRYRVFGEEDYDGLHVGVFAEAPAAGQPKQEYEKSFYEKRSWEDSKIQIPASEAGIRYVVFTWENDGSGGIGPAAAIDEVLLRVELPAPTGLAAENITANSLTLTWNAPADAPEQVGYKVQRQEGFSGPWEDMGQVTETRADIIGLKENTMYFFRVMAFVSEELYSDWVERSVTTPYSCPAPTGVAVASGTDGYEASWETEAEQSVLYYRKEGEEWQSLMVTGKSHRFPDWEPASVYQVKVRSFCSEQDTSLFSGEVSFMTECGVQTLPYVERFETGNWISSSILGCWTIVDANGDDKTWEQNTDGGVDGSGSARYYYSSDKVAEDWLVSPRLRIGENAALSFKVRAHSSSNAEKYSVWISETDAQIASFTELKAEEEITHTEFREVALSLADYSGKEVYIAIKASSDKNKYYLYIDDFVVTTCPAPSDVKIAEKTDALTATSAWIAFTSDAASCTIEYKKEDDADWTVLSDITGKEVELSGLKENTAYEVRIKSFCSETEESLYSGIFRFRTPCRPSGFPFVEDFESVSDIPACWDNTDNNGGGWKVDDNPNNGKFVYYNGSNQRYANLSTPIIDVSSADKERLELVFCYVYGNYTSAGRFKVSFSTDNGMTWTAIPGSYASTSADTVTVPLKDLVGDAASLQIRFEATGTSDWMGSGLVIRDIKIRHTPLCFPPTGLTVSDILFNEATLGWTAPVTGTPVYYEVTYYDQENPEETKQADSAEGAGTSVQLIDLMQNTTYKAAVVTVCETENSEPVTITWQTPYSCPKPERLALRKLTAEEVVLGWESDGDDFTVMYRKLEDEEWITVENIEEKEYTIGEIALNTDYIAKVQVVCTDEDRSIWDSVQFKTPCQAVRIPFEEDFENEFADHAPDCWYYAQAAGDREDIQWQASTDKAKKGTSSLMYNSGDVRAGHAAIMATPLLDFTAEAVYTLDFWMHRTDSYSSKENEGVKIFISETRDTVGAERIAYIHRPITEDPVPEIESEDGWYAYNFDITGSVDGGMKYILLYGISEWGDDFYIDDFRINALYETNIVMKEVKPVVPRANLGQEEVSIVLVNTGLGDFTGDLEVAFRIDESTPVKEIISFTGDDPLMPETEYRYTFTAKADFSAEGKHALTVWAAAAGDPVAWDDTIRTETLHYLPAALPYRTVFNDSIEEDRYMYVVNAGADSLTWIRPQKEEGALLPPHPTRASDDYLYTPGIDMPAGIYEIEAVYGTAEAGKEEKLEIRFASDFEDTATVPVLNLTAVSKEKDSARTVVRLAGPSNRMVRLHGKSEAAQGGLKLYALRVDPVMLETTIDASICQGDVYPFGGKDLTEAGTYTDTVLATNGPDTVVTLNLAVNSLWLFQLDTAICAGAMVEFGGRTYDEAGEYTEEYLTVNGCDSIYQLTLEVLPLPLTPTISRTEESGQVVLLAETEEPELQWYNAEGKIEGEQDQRYTVTEDGLYHATALNGCGESAASNKIEVKLVGNEGAERTEAPVLYPNPAHDFVRISAQTPIEQVVVFAQSGKKAFEANGDNGNTMLLSVAGLSSGVYVVRIELVTGVLYTYKMVVNR